MQIAAPVHSARILSHATESVSFHSTKPRAVGEFHQLLVNAGKLTEDTVERDETPAAQGAPGQPQARVSYFIRDHERQLFLEVSDHGTQHGIEPAIRGNTVRQLGAEPRHNFVAFIHDRRTAGPYLYFLNRLVQGPHPQGVEDRYTPLLSRHMLPNETSNRVVVGQITPNGVISRTENLDHEDPELLMQRTLNRAKVVANKREDRTMLANIQEHVETIQTQQVTIKDNQEHLTAAHATLRAEIDNLKVVTNSTQEVMVNLLDAPPPLPPERNTPWIQRVALCWSDSDMHTWRDTKTTQTVALAREGTHAEKPKKITYTPTPEPSKPVFDRYGNAASSTDSEIYNADRQRCYPNGVSWE